MKDNSIEKSLNNCNFIKAVLMLLVVIYHSCALWKSGGWFNQAPANPSAFLDVLAQWLNSFHVYGFTFVSGFIFYVLKYKKGKYQNKKAFFIGKLKRLIVPYVLVSTLWAGPWYAYYFKASFGDVIKNFMLGVQPAQLWFLLMLFWVFVIAIILPDKVYDSSVKQLIVAMVLYGVGFICGMIFPNVLQIFTGCQYFIFFVFGCIVAKELAGIESKKSKLITIVNSPILLLCLDIAIFAFYMFLGTSDLVVFKLARLCVEVLLHIVGALMAFGVLGRMAERINTKNKVMFLLEEHNFTVYLLHQQIIYGMITLFNGSVPSVILVVINFCAALLIPIGMVLLYSFLSSRQH